MLAGRRPLALTICHRLATRPIRPVGRFRSHNVSAPHNPSEQELMTGVMGFYGTTMQQVQAFELVLAGLVVAVGLTPPSTPPADPEAFLNEMWKVVHKASAGRMRKRLPARSLRTL
jgi:hypothetical protein